MTAPAVTVAMPLQAKKLEKDLRGEDGPDAEQKFVWGKKIEKQIQEGQDLRELGPEAEKRRHEERLVSLYDAHTTYSAAGNLFL